MMKPNKDFYKKFIVEYKNGIWFITNEQFIFKHKEITTIINQINSIIKFILRSHNNFMNKNKTITQYNKGGLK